MSDIHYQPMWPVYKKMRRVLARFRERIGIPADDAAIDADLEQTIAMRTGDLLHLFYRDRAEREARAQMQRNRADSINR